MTGRPRTPGRRAERGPPGADHEGEGEAWRVGDASASRSLRGGRAQGPRAEQAARGTERERDKGNGKRSTFSVGVG